MKKLLLLLLLMLLGAAGYYVYQASTVKRVNHDKKYEIGKEAYNGIHFGMNQGDLVRFRGSSKEYIEKIGDLGYKFEPYFKKDEGLFSLKINSKLYPKDQYSNSLYLHWKNLVEKFEEAYGQPDKPRQYPTSTFLEEGRIILTHIWQLEEKKMELGVFVRDSINFGTTMIITRKKTDKPAS